MSEVFDRDKVQYKDCKILYDGKLTLYNGYWYSTPKAAKGESTMSKNADHEYIEYCEEKLIENNFEDTINLEGQVFTAQWHRDVMKAGLEETKARKYFIVYHDKDSIYNYETHEILMSIDTYLSQLEELE